MSSGPSDAPAARCYAPALRTLRLSATDTQLPPHPRHLHENYQFKHTISAGIFRISSAAFTYKIVFVFFSSNLASQRFAKLPSFDKVNPGNSGKGLALASRHRTHRLQHHVPSCLQRGLVSTRTKLEDAILP